MSPIPSVHDVVSALLVKRDNADNPADRPNDPNGLVLEAWGECTQYARTRTITDINVLRIAQGYMVGSLIIMSCITLANMRRGVLLHKLILLEVGCTRVRGPWSRQMLMI
jgi:hypothetical protein